MNINRLNRREVSIRLSKTRKTYRLTGHTTSCCRTWNEKTDCQYDLTREELIKEQCKISHPSKKMDCLGLN